MKKRWDFFKGSDTSFGLFYPVHYTMAAFDTDSHAEQARNQFLEAGFADEDVATASGSFVVDELESLKDANLFDRWKQEMARIAGTEAGFIEDDIKLARRGGAFVFVYTPDQDSIDRMHALIKRLHPMFARRYHHAGIEAVAYPAQASTL
jgi:hypothetical protein